MAGQLKLATLLAALLLLALPTAGEIYQWTDASGRVHFTEDLARVPAAHREQAQRRAARKGGPSRVQTYHAPPAAPAASRRARAAGGSSRPGGRVHRIAVERAASGMVVAVRLNGRTVSPFLIDTGASYVLIPQKVADELGIHVGAGTRTLRFSTANGVVEQPVVMLDSVELGTARAEDVPASISPSLGIGLLGLSFFNRFTYQVDAAAGIVTLVENGLAESGGIRGGRSEAQWRGEFAALRARRKQLDDRLTSTPSHHSRKIRRLGAESEQLEAEFEALQTEADRARVPDAWRR